MKVKCTDKRTFQLTDNSKSLGQLTYKSLFSFEAEIVLANFDRFKIKPEGLFGTGITVTKDDTEIARLKLNWKGQIVMSFSDGREFVFRPKGAFMNKYFIENKRGEQLMLFDPHFVWSKFIFNYDISYDEKPKDILLILLGVYATNHIIAVMTGAIPG